MIIEFLIKGSSAQPYKVTFQKSVDQHVYSGCNCSCRKSGMICKHIMNILDGDVTNMIQGSSIDIKMVLELIEGTRFLNLYNEYKKGLKLYNSKVLTDMKKALVTKPVE